MADGPNVYDPTNKFEVKVWDTEYRKDGDQVWLARIYQPQKTGLCPCLLYVHGGAWSLNDRTGNGGLNQDLAASGLCVVAIDFRLAPTHTYPAQETDVNFAIRWLKAHAPLFNSDPRGIGMIGSSSGGETAMLCAMKPRDPLFASITLPEVSAVDATVSCVIGLYPVLDPYARYLYAQKAGRKELVDMTKGYFLTEKNLQEGNPQLILDRGEKIDLPPVLIVQGTADNNVPLSIPERFVKSYRAAGGQIELELFEGIPHGFAGTPGPETQRALDIIRKWLALHINTLENKR
jgi:acetyl esterase